MALGAAPTRSRKGIPAVTREANKITSGATFRKGAMTNATGREMAMAATFMMKLVIIMTKKAMDMTKMNQWASLNMFNQLMASHSAAPVCQRQKPMLMAPAKRRMM